MGSMAGTFTIPEFNSSYSITDSNLVRIRYKRNFEKSHEPLTFLKSFRFVDVAMETLKNARF
jgi:hypothetical protein